MGGTSIDCNEHAFLELKGQGSCSLGEVCHLGSKSLHVPLELDLILAWSQLEAEAFGFDFTVEELLALLHVGPVVRCHLSFGCEVGSNHAEWSRRKTLGHAEVFDVVEVEV